MRCPDCNKFVSFDQQDPEIEADINGTQVTGSVRLVLACAECGGELKEANIDFEEDIDHACDEEGDDTDFEVVSTGGEVNDRYENKDRHGKPIKKMRYMKHYYGADITIGVKCNDCEEEFDVEFSVEEQASGFEELT